jgi:hypothetical protein
MQKSRIPLRTFPSPKAELQFLVFPYVRFLTNIPILSDSFKFGPFVLWRDTEENWATFQRSPRPSDLLSMYVGRDGKPLTDLWIATTQHSSASGSIGWQHLSASLFYIAWTRIPFSAIERPAAEDFYFEAFVLPESAGTKPSGHVRWSKYTSTFWPDIKIHPVPEVSFRPIRIDLPESPPRPPNIFHDPTPAQIFESLALELTKTQSSVLTALWFFMEACYHSAARSSFAEDIQNICSAFEALLEVDKKGDSAKQVSDRLKKLFSKQTPSRIEKALSRKNIRERQDVIKRLNEWVKALYNIRNAYTHGKTVNEYFFGERSLWQDAFEIFRLAANRTILKKPEKRLPFGSALEKRLMSVHYFDEAVGFFSKKSGWINTGKKVRGSIQVLKETIRKTRTLDPELVESVSSVRALRQALFNMCTAIYKVVDRSKTTDLAQTKDAMQRAYTKSRDAKGKLNIDTYIRKVAPRFHFWNPLVPFAGKSIPLYELVEAFKTLSSAYGNFTSPILNSFSAANPLLDID